MKFLFSQSIARVIGLRVFRMLAEEGLGLAHDLLVQTLLREAREEAILVVRGVLGAGRREEQRAEQSEQEGAHAESSGAGEARGKAGRARRSARLNYRGSMPLPHGRRSSVFVYVVISAGSSRASLRRGRRAIGAVPRSSGCRSG